MIDERLMRYIPKRIRPMITECYRDSDGYWAACPRGFHFRNTDCHTAHGFTIAEFLADIRSIQEVNYADDWD